MKGFSHWLPLFSPILNFQILPKSAGPLPNSLHSSEWAISLSYPRPLGFASGSTFPIPLLTLLLEWSNDFSPSWIPIRTTSEKSDPNFIKELTGVWNHTGLFNIKNICLKLTFGPIFASIRSQIWKNCMWLTLQNINTVFQWVKRKPGNFLLRHYYIFKMSHCDSHKYLSEPSSIKVYFTLFEPQIMAMFLDITAASFAI